MKTKKTKELASMAGEGEQTTSMAGAIRSPMGNGHCAGSEAAYQMPAEEAAAIADIEDERGMPGVTGRAANEGTTGAGMPGRIEVGGVDAGAIAGGAIADGGISGGGMGSGDGAGNGGAGGPGFGRSDDVVPPRVRTCGTMNVHRRLLSTAPEYRRMRAEIENHALLYESRKLSAQRSGITRIPVVVHVVWNSAAQNISDSQVASQIDVLNRDFRRTNPDVSITPAPFLPLAADARIEFALAGSAPDGAPTSGIERRQTTVAAFSDDDAVKSFATGGLDAWPADRYLNLWVCPLGGGLLGYAQFPGGPAATDGVVILHSAFGTIGSAAAPFNLGRTATHEIGHWLNLNHIWGDDGAGCSGTDNVSDTPNQGGYNTGAPTFPHLSCSNGPNGDMFMNYMDYVDDRAMVMFSTGQVARMQACLDGVRSAIGSGVGAIRPSSSPVLAWGPTRIDAFALATNRALYHKWWDGAAWGPSATGFENLGGTCTSAPQAVSWGSGRLDLFVTGTDSALYHKWWNGSSWGPSVTGYQNLGGICVGDPRSVSWGPNRLDVFVLGANRALYHKWLDGVAWGPSAGGYQNLGGVCLGQPEAVSWGPNRLDVFVIGTDRALYHKWWDGSAWGPSATGYERLGGVCASSPHAVAWGPNRLDVFVTGTDGALYHKWFDGAAWGPSATGFERLGGACVGEPEVVSWGPNRLDVFVLGTDSAVYHKAWNGSAWGPSDSGYEKLGGVCTSQPRVAAWGPDRLDIFVTGTDSALYHKAWTGSAWGPSPTGFDYLGGVVSAFRQAAPKLPRPAPSAAGEMPAMQREARTPDAAMGAS